MARRKSTGTAEDTFDLFHEIFMHVPTWVRLPVAGVVFVTIKLVIARVAGGQPFLVPLVARFRTLAAGFFAFIFVFAEIMAEIKKRMRRRLLNKQQGLYTIRDLNWAEFELLMGDAYRRLGYAVTEPGGGGVDGGIDLKLRNQSGQIILVRCKQWRVSKVGEKPVREFIRLTLACATA